MSYSQTVSERLVDVVGQELQARSSEDALRLANLFSRLQGLRDRGLLSPPRYTAPSQGELEREYSLRIASLAHRSPTRIVP
jgi:hypothetical protein